jgi:hypothetical protein
LFQIYKRFFIVEKKEYDALLTEKKYF